MSPFCIAMLIFLTGSSHVSGLPTGPQPATPDTEDSGDKFSLEDETSKIGYLADFFRDQMVDQCNGCIDPAVQFYGCIEKMTRLPTCWAIMGLNATVLSYQTVKTMQMHGGKVTEEQDASLSVVKDGIDYGNRTLKHLFDTIGTESDNLCMNGLSEDGLLACLNPYLEACFPDSDSGNLLQQQTAPASSSTPTAMIPDVEGRQVSSDDDATPVPGDNNPDTFFMIPFLETQSQIYPLLQQTLVSVCNDHAKSLKSLIKSIPCLMKSVNQGQKSCGAVCEKCKGVAVNESLSTTTSAPEVGGGPLDPLICSALKDCIECQVDLADQTCGIEVADVLHHIVKIYFNTLQCFPGTNGDTIRPPFNVAIL